MPVFTIPLVRPGIDWPTPKTNRAQTSAAIFRRSNLARYLRADWFRCLLLMLIGFAVRSPALQGQRIWDDQYLSQDNPFIKSPLLILEAFRHYLFLDSFSPHYRPVQNISFIVDYFFWNTNEFGFHTTNVLLHVGSGILLYFLLRKLFASLWLRGIPLAVRERASRRLQWISLGAFIIALLWVVHPVHSAAVDYISGRADSLAFFFAAAGWFLFLRAQRIARPFSRASIYFLAAICGLLALLSREIAGVWIILFLMHLFFVERRFSLRLRIGALLCCLGLVAIYLGLRQLPAQRLIAASHTGWAAPGRAVLMLRALGDYGRLMIFPANLHMERTVFVPASLRNNYEWRTGIGSEYLSILGLLLLGALIFGSMKKGRGQAARVFGAAWFLMAYLPISNLIDLNATVAEHWLYLPSVGFLVFFFGCAIDLPIQLRRIGAPLVALAVIGLGLRSFVRSSDWANEERFYERTFAAGGTNARVAVNLGRCLAARGAYAEAEKMYRQALEETPDYPVAQNNLADTLWRQGKKKEAEILFGQIEKSSTKIRTEYPRTWIGARNLAAMHYSAHKGQSALAILDKARADYPEVWELISLESEILRRTEQPDAALRLVQNFAHDNWWHYGAALALGRLYAQRGDTIRAEAALHRAIWLDVHDAEAMQLMVMIRMHQNRLDEAFRMQQRAIARQPDEPRQYILLSEILEKMGRDDEAHAALIQVNRLQALAKSQTAFN
jgi:tetratricopeptide (TPR) repeat protein